MGARHGASGHTVSALGIGAACCAVALRRNNSAKSTGLIISGGKPPSRVVSAMMLISGLLWLAGMKSLPADTEAVELASAAALVR